jgi:hypothetical protein
LRVEWTADAGLNAGCLKPADIDFVIKLIEDVLAVTGWCDGAGVAGLCTAAGVLRDKVALLIERHIGGDEDGNWECCTKLGLC